MMASQSIYHLMRADFLERVRRYSFLIVMAATLYVGISFLPSIDAGYLTVSVNQTRGIYNSAWIGAIFGLTLTTVGTLPGFYLIKLAVQRDRETGVGQIIAATQIKKASYLFGKVASNFAVLLVVLFMMMLIAPVMQIIRAESLPVDLITLYAPMVLMYLPMAAFIASLAVLFETIPFLRGGIGNIVYLFFWSILVVIAMEGSLAKLDLMGGGAVVDSITSTYTARSGLEVESFTIGRTLLENELVPFNWEGTEWTSAYILRRALYFVLALFPLIPAALLFDRFDPARRKIRWWDGLLTQIKEGFRSQLSSLRKKPVSSMSGEPTIRIEELSPAILGKARLLAVTVGEFKLLVKGMPWWWYLVALGLNVSALAGTTASLREGLLAILWIWPMLAWSKLGARENIHNTKQIVFSAPRVISRQFAALWFAGLAFTALSSLGAGIHLLLAGEIGFFAAWCVAMVFTPSLALALSSVSGTHRLFEVIYLILWFLAINGLTATDYMGLSQDALLAGNPVRYLGASVILLAVAVAGRVQQARS